MKKILVFLMSLALCLGMLTGCAAAKEEKIIKVAASPTPHAWILKTATEALAEEGWTLEVLEYSDYEGPNHAVANGEADANFFQHVPYLDAFNAENGTSLTAVAEIHYEPFALYPGTKVALEDLTIGDKIVVPKDGSNRARALMLLESAGLIRLAEDAGMQATILDILENPRGLQIVELDASQIDGVRDTVAMAVINGNYALEAGLFAGTDGIVSEYPANAARYANVLVVREGSENSEKTRALIAALQSEAVREYIESAFPGSVIPCF